MVNKFKKEYEKCSLGELWEEYWQKMSMDKEWADQVVVQGTAWFLHHDITIIMDSATTDNPFITISGNHDESTNPSAGVPLLLGYLRNLHYQSLVPEDEGTFRPRFAMPMTNKDIIQKGRMNDEGENMKRKSSEEESGR